MTIKIPASFPVRPLRTDKARKRARLIATCGTCGLSWDDAKATSYTPAPGARCPFEEFHDQPEPIAFDVEDLITAADNHGIDDGDAAYAQGDLEEILRAAWGHLDDAGKRAVLASETGSYILRAYLRDAEGR